ncbi:glycosyltransferase family 2 protein [Ligilactobacillus salivarius]|uniref:glycosyltransferase family 2 protein n=1 Tax=Ligilactobacillus salivarius TaxID=1624 RepID=UPI00164F2596|nr:glycosyltransferase family 2 protein [Ligilactobacillus salivarius]
MKKKYNVGVVVVTYNRKELLRECLEEIESQTYPVNKIFIIDNNSTDGTFELLKNTFLKDKNIVYKRLDENIGGAGGFYEGIKLAMESNENFDFLWIMDDDTIPYKDSLETLIEGYDEQDRVSYLASCVRGEKNEPMNVPVIDDTRTANGYSDWYFKLRDKKIKIKTATFVSILITINAIKKVGLPCKNFYIWGDDTEYTTRLTSNYGNAYMIGNSWVSHKRKNAQALSIMTEVNKDRIDNYFYHYRNNMIVTGLYAKNSVYTRFAKNILQAFKVLNIKYGRKKSFIILKGTFIGFKEIKTYKKYIIRERKRYRE